MTAQRVLITGASGFLGSHLVRAALLDGLKIVAVDRNSAPASTEDIEYVQVGIEDVGWRALLEKFRVDRIFHLAGTSSVAKSVSDPMADFERAIPATAKILFEASRCPWEIQMVYYSSAAVYGNPLRLPIDEEARAQPISPYGLNKHVAEQLIIGAASCYGTSANILRIFSAYGPGLRKQLFFDVDAKAREALRTGAKVIELHGTGAESRDFIHGADVARAALRIGEQRIDGVEAIYNVASGVETTIREAVELYLRVARLPVAVRFSGQVRAGDPLNWRADITKLNSLGFKPEFELERGLESYGEWMAGRS